MFPSLSRRRGPFSFTANRRLKVTRIPLLRLVRGSIVQKRFLFSVTRIPVLVAHFQKPVLRFSIGPSSGVVLVMIIV